MQNLAYVIYVSVCRKQWNRFSKYLF